MIMLKLGALEPVRCGLRIGDLLRRTFGRIREKAAPGL